MAERSASELSIVEDGGEVRYVLPMAPGVSWRGPAWDDRVAAGFLWVLSVGMLAAAVGIAAGTVRVIARDWPPESQLRVGVMVGEAISGGFGVFVTLAVAALGTHWLWFRRPPRLVLSGAKLCYEWSFLGRARRWCVAREDLRDVRVELRPRYRRPPPQREDPGDPELVVVTARFPWRRTVDLGGRAVLVALAKDLRQRLGLPADQAVLELASEAFLQGEGEMPPAFGARYVVREEGERLSVTQRRPTWAEFRVVLPVLLFMTLSSLLIVGGIVGVRWVSSKALHGVDYMVIGILLVLFNYVWVGVLMVVVSPLRITAGSEGLSARWRAVSVPVWRRIVRSRLASIALAITRADNSHRPVLVVGRDDGRSIELAGGRADDLRYIATLLRRRLGVPAVAARREARPELDAAWHQTDDVQTQGTFDISVQDTAEGSVITVRQKYRWLGWVVAGAMLCAAAALQFVLRPHLTDIGAQVSMAISGVLAFLGVLYAGLGVLLERDRHVFRIDADSFTYARTSLMKPRTRRWRRAEIRAVGTEGIGPANMPRLRLVAWLTDERSVVLHQPRLATPRERREWRHIATLLRRRLGVPARPEE